MKATRLLAMLLIVTLPAAVFAQPAEPPQFEQPPFAFYYLDPKPETIPALLEQFQKEGRLQLGRMTAAGFLSQVFRDNPGRLKEWAPAIWRLDDKAREYVWLAVWFSGTDPGLALLQEAAGKEKDSVKVLTSSKVASLFDFPVDSGEILDLFWGAFFATGREEYITKLIEITAWAPAGGQVAPPMLQLPKEDFQKQAIGLAAQWSLRSHARTHPRIVEICKNQLEKQTGETKQVLASIVNEAGGTLGKVATADSKGQLAGDLEKLREIANGYPPRIETAEDRSKAEALWRSVESRLLKDLKASPWDFETVLWLGDCYRMGHNLDVEGAWDKAVAHLTDAALLRPDSPLPPTLLGQHYAGSGHPAEAEKQLLRAVGLSGGKPSPQLHFFLAFTYYQAGKFDKVVPAATEYLKVDPDSQLMTLLKDRAEAALRGEFKPNKVEIQVDPKHIEKNVIREGDPPRP